MAEIKVFYEPKIELLTVIGKLLAKIKFVLNADNAIALSTMIQKPSTAASIIKY